MKAADGSFTHAQRFIVLNECEVPAMGLKNVGAKRLGKIPSFIADMTRSEQRYARDVKELKFHFVVSVRASRL